jgi:uncharacterized phage-like protein YoqJ
MDMIITFCGHSQFFSSNEYQNRLIEILEHEVGDLSAEMYLGGYGGFDSFAYSCCKKYKQTNASISLVFVTPYIKIDPIVCQNYDSILYPGLEDKLPRYAITYRNRFMVDKADLIIAYIDHEWGGAYNTYKYAKKKGKRIINLAEMQ